jgi:CubicO group peptidase (beta-lactamase class C family)
VVGGRGRVLAALAGLVVASGHGAAAQSSPRLAAVDRFLREEVRRQRIPGISVAVVRGDRVLLARGYGYANVELRVPATDSTVYQSGSLGKQFTAALVLQLADSGRLGLDDPIRRYFPEGPARWDSVTVRHLLTHTSGIPDYTDSVVDLRRDYTEDELVRVAADLPPLFRAGDKWSYSNTGYVLLGILVHRVTGRFYGELLGEWIFGPLGMRTARIISEADIVPNRAAGYRLVGDTLRNQEWVSPSLNTTADGSLYLTVNDLARWAMGLDAHRVLSRSDLAAAWTPVRLTGGGTYPYGLGWSLAEMRAQPRIGHTGAWQGFRTSIQRFPTAGLTVIVLANLAEAHPEAISLAVAGILEPALTPPHRLAAPLAGPAPPAPIEILLAALGSAADTGRVIPGFLRVITDADRSEWRKLLSETSAWTPLGCDAAEGHAIARLGAAVAHVCYARAHAADDDLIVTVSYTADWRAADVDSYRF